MVCLNFTTQNLAALCIDRGYMNSYFRQSLTTVYNHYFPNCNEISCTFTMKVWMDNNIMITGAELGGSKPPLVFGAGGYIHM